MASTLRALRPVYGGHVLARDEGVLFLRGALPGELVTVEVRARRKDFAFADVVAVIEPSPHRVAAPCPVYGACGGCQLQHADYECQLSLKRQSFSDVLARTGKLSVEPQAVHGSRPFHYRHRAQFKSDGSRVGFYRAESREIVPLPPTGCPLMIAPINDLLPLCREAALETGSRDLHVASDGTDSLLYLKGAACAPSALDRFLGRGAAGVHCDAGGRGAGSIAFRLGELDYRVSARTFFQANWPLNLSLVERVANFVPQATGTRVLDLYAGAGNFSLPLARAGAEVVAVEENRDAFADLRANVAANGLANCRIVRSRIEAFRPGRRPYGAVVVDPPREGLSEKALGLLRAVAAPRLVYVSCSPPTLARDLAKLRAAGYGIEAIELFDLFPNSYHIEALVVLARA